MPMAKLLSPNLAGQLVPQRLTATMIEPRHVFRIGHAEGRPEEIGEGAMLTEMEAGSIVPYLGGSVLHRLKCLQAGDEFTSGKDPHRELAVGHLSDALREEIGACAKARQTLGPRRDHAPLGAALCDRGPSTSPPMWQPGLASCTSPCFDNEAVFLGISA